jgi:hypothetical protein
LNGRKVELLHVLTSKLDNVSKYILSQEEHHSRKSFQKEYLSLLEENDVIFKNEYVFEFFD